MDAPPNDPVRRIFVVGLPHLNRSPREGSYRDAYDDEAREVVADWFRADLEAFEYEF